MKLSLYLYKAMEDAVEKHKANKASDLEDSIDPTHLSAIEFLKEFLVLGGSWKLGPCLVPRKQSERHRWLKEPAIVMCNLLPILPYRASGWPPNKTIVER